MIRLVQLRAFFCGGLIVAYENISMSSARNLIDPSLESLAAKTGVATRSAQQELHGNLNGPLRALFGTADHLVASIGKCIG